MVEGHGVHRVAVAHRRALVGKRFAATSPNGRFVEGARAIDRLPLRRVEAVGKNLFYFFERDARASSDADDHVVHVHFGMSGRFSTHASASAPDPTPTTRLRLENEEHGLVALLSAMTVDLIDVPRYAAKRLALGQDPLRDDADPDALWDKFRASRKSVGLALMDQSMFAGVGNIYRAEILFKAGVHPERPCAQLPRDEFDLVWRHSVELLQRGFVNGSILTVDPEEAKRLGEPWTRRYVYNQSTCGRCGASIRSWDVANRTVYACEACQPPPAPATLPEARVKRIEASKRAAAPFVSHCAPDSDAANAMDPSKLTVARLKEALDEWDAWPSHLRRSGARKADLVSAVREARAQKANAVHPGRNFSPPPPGTAHLEARMNSPEAAAAEKIAAGEKGNVEHVALGNDASAAVRADAKAGKAEASRRSRLRATETPAKKKRRGANASASASANASGPATPEARAAPRPRRG